MPVNIIRVTPKGQKNESIAWLCDDEWRLTPQSEALTAWLQAHGTKLEPAEYVADIGFSWRRDAMSGGPAFSPDTLRQMADLGMSLHISEYQGFTDEIGKQSGTSEAPSNNSLERTRER